MSAIVIMPRHTRLFGIEMDHASTHNAHNGDYDTVVCSMFFGWAKIIAWFLSISEEFSHMMVLCSVHQITIVPMPYHDFHKIGSFRYAVYFSAASRAGQ